MQHSRPNNPESLNGDRVAESHGHGISRENLGENDDFLWDLGGFTLWLFQVLRIFKDLPWNRGHL